MIPQIIATPIPIGNANWKHPSIGANIARGISKRMKPVNVYVPANISLRSMIAFIPIPIPQIERNMDMHWVNLGPLEIIAAISAIIPAIIDEKKQIVIPMSPSGI